MERIAEPKFLLVHPEISRTRYNFAGVIENEPLELEYLCSILREQGYHPEIFDKQVEPGSVKAKLESYVPDCLYVCGRTRQEDYIKEYCRAAKAVNPAVVTIVGGIHAQHATDRLFCEEIDYVLASFDLYKVPEIFQSETTGEPKREGISGISYWQNGEYIQNPAEPFDIKRLPEADRSYLYSHLGNYRYLELLPCAHVRTAYSCPYNCAFCYRNRLNCGTYVTRDIEDVVEEIAALDVPNIYFIDDDFLVDKRRVERFIELVEEKGIQKQYVCYGRADFIVRNPQLMRRLKAIGFYYVLVGLEAVDDNYLQRYHKRIDTGRNAQCVQLMNEIGIHTMGMFILDLDFEKKQFKNLYKWIKQHNLRHAAVSIFAPEFGLETYNMYKERLITDNPEHWDYLHLVARPENLSVRQFYFQYYKLLIRLFLRGWRQGIYGFIDYGAYIRSILGNIFKLRKQDD